MREPLNSHDAITIFVVVILGVLGITAGILSGWAVYEAIHKDPVDVSYLCPVTDSMRIFVTECRDEGYSTAQCYYTYVDAQCFGSVMLEMPVVAT